MRRISDIGIIVTAGLVSLMFLGVVLAADAPHNGSENVSCDTCHIAHAQLGNSQGAGLTKDTNENLCISCHNSTGEASSWPFASSDQATPGTSGTSHRWDRSMTANVAPLNLKPGTDADSPNNVYGLRASGYCSNPAYTNQSACTAGGATWTSSEIKSSTVRTQMTKYNNVIVCSVCHMQHSQAKAPFDPYSASALTGDAGIIDLLTNSNKTLTDKDTSKNWGVNAFSGYYVVMTSGASIGLYRSITSNDAYSVTLSSAFPSATQVVQGDTYYITQNSSSTASGSVATGDSTAPYSTFQASADSGYCSNPNCATQSTCTSTCSGTWTTTTWTVDRWAGYFVKMKSGANLGLRRRILSNDVNGNITTEAFPGIIVPGDTYYITSNRHFMRVNNALNDLCNDCHYYRATSTGTDVKTYDGNKKSHPVGKNLNQYNASTNPNGVQDATQFNAAFLEPSSSGWGAQTGTRSEQNSIGYCSNPQCTTASACTTTCGGTWTATADGNITNNVTVGIDKRVGCLSCHNVHYSDSDSSTVDTPSGSAP